MLNERADNSYYSDEDIRVKLQKGKSLTQEEKYRLLEMVCTWQKEKLLVHLMTYNVACLNFLKEVAKLDTGSTDIVKDYMVELVPREKNKGLYYVDLDRHLIVIYLHSVKLYATNGHTAKSVLELGLIGAYAKIVCTNKAIFYLQRFADLFTQCRDKGLGIVL